MSGFVVWFTGLSGSGKSTLAAMLSAELRHRGVHVEVLDGDEVRTHLSKGLTFSKEDRDTNVRRIGYVAKLLARSGACAMTAMISPYRAIRDEQRQQVDRFLEVYCKCEIAVLAERDVKGLYKKALAGEIKNFTGIDDPYEAPIDPEVTAFTDKEPKEVSLQRILGKLEELRYLSPGGGGGALGPARSPRSEPHGGHLVHRRARTLDRKGASLLEGRPVIQLDERTEADLEMLSLGAYSPLKGFMGSKDYLRVVREMRLENGLVWPIPITLAVSEEVAATLRVGEPAALHGRDGALLGLIDVTDTWTPDKDLEARLVYRTEAPDHPGVAYLRASGPVYVGGEVLDFRQPAVPSDSPQATRSLFTERGWRRVVGFQTHNPMHRAHEYITKSALETCDGLLIHPSTGATKPDDIPADVRMRSYEALLAGYYPKDRAVLAPCSAAMRWAGPREAVFHALIRKNHGCSHFIVGRDHAGIDGHYGPHDAQKIFDEFAPGELGIQAMCVEDAFYSTAMGGMATLKTAPEDPATRIEMSGTKVREMLARGELPSEEIVRPEVARILIEATKTAAR